MLEEMRISGLGVLDDAVLEFGPGLTAVTGETGAGKTMVVQGLALLFGGRADAALVRPGAARLVVEGRLAVDEQGRAAQRARDAGAELDEGTLLVSRAVAADGRSRAHVGGRAAPVGLLADLAEELVAVHGQADQHRLVRPGAARRALDRFAGSAVTEPLGGYRAAFRRWSRVTGELDELVTRARERAQEADLLRFGLAEIESAAPGHGEEATLAAEIERLRHADGLRTAAAAAHDCLLGDPGTVAGVDATGLVAQARRLLERESGHDRALAGLAERLAEASYLLADVAADLASYADGVDADPVRLAAAQDRQAVLTRLIRKYAGDLQGVLEWAAQARRRLGELDGDDARIGELTEERDRLVEELSKLSTVVSAGREAAAARFGASVSAELAALAMPHARVSVAVTQTECSRGESGPPRGGMRLAFTPDGTDAVELTFAAHPGAAERPLHRGASGGELSRVMLAIEVVFAGADPVPTMVFDEVDAGVGGRAAVEVGRRLARLARHHQVIVVTHLPQVAAFADRHLLLVKADDGVVTRSGVRTLVGEARLRELSRMLAGLEDSALARNHAEELLVAAASAKAAD